MRLLLLRLPQYRQKCNQLVLMRIAYIRATFVWSAEESPSCLSVRNFESLEKPYCNSAGLVVFKHSLCVFPSDRHSTNLPRKADAFHQRLNYFNSVVSCCPVTRTAALRVLPVHGPWMPPLAARAGWEDPGHGTRLSDQARLQNNQTPKGTGHGWKAAAVLLPKVNRVCASSSACCACSRLRGPVATKESEGSEENQESEASKPSMTVGIQAPIPSA